MFELIREHQLNIMLNLCAVCTTMAIMLLFTRFLRPGRKRILVFMLVLATCLLGFDRLAYVYAGDSTSKGYIMVRVSNFMVFFLTSVIVFSFNMYVMDILKNDMKLELIPRRMWIVHIMSVIGMLLAAVAAFTGLYYTFDENNQYHRSGGFLIAYIIPVVGPILIYSVIRQYRKQFSKMIYISLVLYIFFPILVGIIQIFTYGLSIVNMAMVLVSVSLYIFTYLDINDEVERVHKLEMDNLLEEHKSMKRLFEQTAMAFVTAVEKRTPYSQGHSKRVASVARTLARNMNKSDDECDEVYYAALLHDVGLAAIPDEVLAETKDTEEGTNEILRQKPVIGGEILDNIREYPYLGKSVLSACERYDGKGYPEGLSGDNIPEISRMIAIAEAYDKMTVKQGSNNPLPEPVVREEFVMGAGDRFDPDMSNLMIHLMDSDLKYVHEEMDEAVEKELTCGKYRESVSKGIPVDSTVTRISFKCTPDSTDSKTFSGPSIILFDSFDRHVHRSKKSINAYHYTEYGEVWFDGHGICTGARKMETDKVEEHSDDDGYYITASRYEDHLKIETVSSAYRTESIFALPDRTKAAYIGITGENCHITDIDVSRSIEETVEGDIRRIAEEISFIDRIESDVANVQIDRYRSSTTTGMKVEDRLRIGFHAMALPSATLVWHCPYIVLFYSDDKTVGGKNYHEYALIKLNGEYEAVEVEARNEFKMNKSSDFQGWNIWKEEFQKGIECEVLLLRKGKSIRLYTDTLGIKIENTTIPDDDPREVYVALTGDEVALTDIRLWNN
ncbi:MAG: HD domain-containing protein [Lachnospiraceae bacterium]|nr:HD domain-containing protein [Lachnospiraceae bacterium]